MRKIIWKQSEINAKVEHELDDDESSYSEANDMMSKITISNQIMQTPFGLALVSQPDHPAKDTEFFIGHTNFDIDENVFNAINKTTGVDYFRVLSRYRFIIGIGIAFYFKDVKRDIESTVIGYQHNADSIEEDAISPHLRETNDIPANIQAIMQDVIESQKDIPFWVAYVIPNGEVVIEEADDAEDFKKLKKLMAKMVEYSHGYLVTSDN